MQVFKTDRNIYLTNQLISWVWTIAFVLLVYFGFKLLSPQPIGRLLVPISLIILYRLRDTLTQFHVKKIKVDAQTNQLSFLLQSVMSGQKIRNYDLRQIKSELITYSRFASILYSSMTLKVLLPKNEVFRISSRYGFSANTLTLIDNALNNPTTLHGLNKVPVSANDD